jgi:hypothetical protein
MADDMWFNPKVILPDPAPNLADESGTWLAILGENIGTSCPEPQEYLDVPLPAPNIWSEHCAENLVPLCPELQEYLEVPPPAPNIWFDLCTG